MKDDPRIKQIQKLLDVAEGNLASARSLLLDILGEKKTGKVDHKESAKDLSVLDEGKIIEGVFDGEQMVAPNGKKYPVPANYASKSKLVEGDTLKLTIAEDGSLIYKQINPVERKNLIGTLKYENGEYSVLAEGKNYKVLFASVTYYKGEPGSKASVVVPAGKDSTWAALESIIHEHDESTEKETPKEEKEEAEEASPQVPEKKIELPEENKEILREVRESFENKKEAVEKSVREDIQEETDRLEANAVNEAVSKISEDMTLDEASQASVLDDTPKENAADEHPDIKKHGDYMPEEEAGFIKEEKDINSLGEKAPVLDDEKGKTIQELEI